MLLSNRITERGEQLSEQQRISADLISECSLSKTTIEDLKRTISKKVQRGNLAGGALAAYWLKQDERWQAQLDAQTAAMEQARAEFSEFIATLKEEEEAQVRSRFSQ